MRDLPIQFYAGSRPVCFRHAVESLNTGVEISAKAIANEDEWEGHIPQCYLCREVYEEAQARVCSRCGGDGMVDTPGFMYEFGEMSPRMECPDCGGSGEKG